LKTLDQPPDRFDTVVDLQQLSDSFGWMSDKMQDQSTMLAVDKLQEDGVIVKTNGK